MILVEIVRWLHDHRIHVLCQSRRIVERKRIEPWPFYVLPDGTLYRPDLNGINGFGYPTIREMHRPRWDREP